MKENNGDRELGPNGIAMAAVSRVQHIDFLDWMLFAFPLALGLVLGAIALVLLLLKPKGHSREPGITGLAQSRRWRTLAGLSALTVALWLSEPLHGLRASTVALGTILSLFLSGVLRPRDATRLDWATLALIAGGIGLGKLLEAAGFLSVVAETPLPPWNTVRCSGFRPGTPRGNAVLAHE